MNRTKQEAKNGHSKRAQSGDDSLEAMGRICRCHHREHALCGAPIWLGILEGHVDGFWMESKF